MNRIPRQHIVVVLFAFITMVFEIAAAPGLVIPQEAGWTTPAMISSQQVTGWFPDITADSTGRVHVTWAAGTSGFDTVLYTSSLDGISWSGVNDIAAVPQNGTDSAATRPALWVDASGFLNLSYVSTTLYFTRAPINTAGSAGAWSQPLKLNGAQVAYFSRIIQDPHGQLHLFYTENVVSNNCTQCYHLFQRISADNGSSWLDPLDISADGTGAAKPQVIVDDKGGLFAVWESGIGGGTGQLSGPSVVKFAASSDFGKTWSSSMPLSPSTVQEAKDVTLGMDGSGRLVAVWLAVPDNTVNYMTSTDAGKTWSRSTPIDGISGSWDVYPSKLDDYSLVTDSSGALHLVLVGQMSTAQAPTSTQKGPTPTPPALPLSVLHLTWQNGEWSQPEIVTQFTGDVPEWPRAAISSGNQLNLVWFVRDQANVWNSDNAHYRIWYTRKQLDSPALPTVVPTIAFTATLSEKQDLTPTIPLTVPVIDFLPTLAPEEKQPVKATYSEDDYVTIFAKSLAPAVFLIVGVGFFILFLRRRR